MNFKYPSEEDLKRNPMLHIEEVGECPGLSAKKYKVHRYTELVYLVSHLRFLNKEHFILYRGESKEHLNDNTLSFLPTIFRSDSDFEELKNKTEKLGELEELKEFCDENKEIVIQSFIQHYGLCKTPYLDLTQSLRIAYSMGLINAGQANEPREKIYVYLFALPYPCHYITNVQDITMVNLTSICPPLALRPQLQEGYLVKYNDDRKDFNEYLLAGIEIDKKELDDSKKFAVIHTKSLLENEMDGFRNKVEEVLNKSH